MDKGHLLIVIDEDFISKKEQKLLKEEKKLKQTKTQLKIYLIKENSKSFLFLYFIVDK